jgi:hypothetical protein
MALRERIESREQLVDPLDGHRRSDQPLTRALALGGEDAGGIGSLGHGVPPLLAGAVRYSAGCWDGSPSGRPMRPKRDLDQYPLVYCCEVEVL